MAKALEKDRINLSGRPVFVSECVDKKEKPTKFKVIIPFCFILFFLFTFIYFFFPTARLPLLGKHLQFERGRGGGFDSGLSRSSSQQIKYSNYCVTKLKLCQQAILVYLSIKYFENSSIFLTSATLPIFEVIFKHLKFFLTHKVSNNNRQTHLIRDKHPFRSERRSVEK